MMATGSTVPDSPTSGTQVTRLRLAIARLARRQRQQAGISLTPSLQSALAMIDTRGPLTLGELAAVEQISPPTITRIVSKLEARGLATRVSDPHDGRVTRVMVSEAGHQQLSESRERRDLWLRRRLDQLPPDDRAALLAAVEPLERLLDLTDESGPAE